MGFSDPLVAGYVLIRQEVRSPDYVAGVSGWILRRDGYAEFNEIVVRGSGSFGPAGGPRIELSDTGVLTIYNSSNQLVAQLDATGLFVQDLATGAQAGLRLTGGSTLVQLLPPDLPGFILGAGQLLAKSDPGNSDAWSELSSPTIDGGARATISLLGEEPGNSPAQIAIDTPLITVLGMPIGLGFVGADGSKANSSAIGTTETAVLTTGTIDFLDNRAYRVEWGPNLQFSTAGRANVRVRQNSDSGNLLSLFVPEATATATPTAHGGTCHVVNTSGATISDVLVLTLQATAGTVLQNGSATTPRYLTVVDIGDASPSAQEISVALV